MITGVDVNMPTVRDADRCMYIREWSGGILAGCFETDGRPCFQDGVPQSFEFQLLPEDWDHIRKIDINNLLLMQIVTSCSYNNNIIIIIHIKILSAFFHIKMFNPTCISLQ